MSSARRKPEFKRLWLFPNNPGLAGPYEGYVTECYIFFKNRWGVLDKTGKHNLCTRESCLAICAAWIAASERKLAVWKANYERLKGEPEGEPEEVTR